MQFRFVSGLRLIQRFFWPLFLCGVTGGLSLITFYYLVWPAYQNPIARMYTSRLGYATVLRSTGRPFSVFTAVAQMRTIEDRLIGEGLMQAEPVQVPMIAMARIDQVHGIEGQFIRKGDPLVTLNDQRLQLKIQAAEAALETALAEEARVQIGSVNVLLFERPELNRVQLETAQEMARMERQIELGYRSLLEKEAISREEYLKQNLKALAAETRLRELEWFIQSAETGKEQSLKIASAAIREVQLTLAHRRAQLADYRSAAPADGVIERVLVHAGEYNQDPGRPAMLLACGLWFETHMDQGALSKLNLGAKTEVHLGAFPGQVFCGTVERVIPLVAFSTGGPETNRPIRPRGTGAPEWPATFKARIHLDQAPPSVVPGMTGFSTVILTRHSLCVPQGAVSAVSGNRGLVFVVDPEKTSFQPRNVLVGTTNQGWTEILEGLDPGEEIIADGYQVLEPGDEIETSEWNPVRHLQPTGTRPLASIPPTHQP